MNKNRKVVKTTTFEPERIPGMPLLSWSKKEEERQKEMSRLLSDTFQTKSSYLSESSLILMSRRDAIAKQLALSLLKPIIDNAVNAVADGLVKGSFAKLQEACKAVEEAEHKLTFELPLAPRYKGRLPKRPVKRKKL